VLSWLTAPKKNAPLQDISAVEDAKRACEKEGEMELTDDFIKVVRMQPARENASRA